MKYKKIKMINVIYNTLKNIKQFIYLSLAMFFLMSNLVYGGDELNKVYAEIEKEHKNFIKETKKIREQFKSLTGVTDSAEAMIIDHAIEEMNQVMEFAHESFKDNDLEMTAMTLDYIDRSLNDINHLVPKEFTNDLSVIDMSSMSEEHVQQIMETTPQMQVNKKEKLTSLVEGMTEIEQKGLNLFEVSKNLNEIGVDTLNVEDIAKAVSEDPSLKAGVLEAVEKGVSPEDFSKQLETMAEAERLGIAESTAAVSEAADAAGLVKNAMPSLETMQSDFFDADAHNAAMAELAADIASGEINSSISKAEAAVRNYTEDDRAAQVAKSKRQETCPQCD